MSHRWSKESRAKLSASIKRKNAEKKAEAAKAVEYLNTRSGRIVATRHSPMETSKPKQKRRNSQKRGWARKDPSVTTLSTETRNKVIHLTAKLLRMLPDEHLVDMVAGLK